MSIFGRLKRSIFGDSAETKPSLSAGKRLAAQQHQVADADDGVVTDTRTGLMWMRCALGQTWDGTTCIGRAQAFSWSRAMALRHSFAGYDDWRLPSIDELKSIVDKPTDFPRSIGGAVYWSSSLSSGNSPFSMTENGTDCRDYPEHAYWVRLVRGGQSLGAVENNATTSPAQALPASTQAEVHKDVPSNIIASPIEEEASGDFVIRSDGVVTDTRTGLMWMRCALGQTWDGTTCIGQPQIFTWDQAMALSHSFAGYDDWRLPNIDELKGIVDKTRVNPACDTTAFPNAPSRNFWSDSFVTNSSRYALYVYFGYGLLDSNGCGNGYCVRLVRSGQSLDALNDGTISKATSSPVKDVPASIQVETQTDESTNIMDSPIREEASGNFIIRNNGTVTDTRTGLMWMRCALGNFISTWNGATCTRSGKENFTWDQAMALRHSFAGYDDWRLPSIDELKSIVDKTQMPPAIVVPRVGIGTGLTVRASFASR